MSRTDDYGLENNNREPQEHSHRVFDHSAEITSRFGLTHDAAKQEMEKFLGVAEYETRKLVGQHSTLRQPEAPAQDAPKRQKRSDMRRAARQIEKRETAPATEVSAERVAAEVQPVAEERPEPSEG